MPLACHASETMQTIQPARKSAALRAGPPAGRRQQLHHHIGERLEVGYAGQASAIAAALRADGYAATSLPPHFSGHCWFGRSGLSLCELTTYHAHCCVNDREKLAVIGRVLRDSAGCDFAHSAPGARSRCTLGECG